MKKYNYLLFCFLLAFASLLLASKNSFLYVFNNWVDANAFFTVGKSMFNGLVLYKDIFEQKGPLLFLIYGIGYLFSHNTFHGVFILEVLSGTVFLYYVYKIFNIFFKKRYSLFLLPALTMVMTVSVFFVHGGSCEEFCLPFIAISLYYYIKHFKKKELTNKEIIINGLMAGSVFMMKYTLLGFWIAFCLFICINYIRKKEFKKIIIFCGFFLLGMIIPFSLGLVYFIINNGVKEFINVYFVFNMTSYSDSENFGLFTKIIKIFIYMFSILKELIPLAALLLLSIIFSFMGGKKNILFRLSLVGFVIITLFFTCWGLKTFIYYYLPILVLVLIFVEIFVIEVFKAFIDDIIDKKITIVLSILFIIGMLFMTYMFANYKEEIGYTKKDYVQYKYADYMSEYKNPTLLNMGFLDMGLYTVSGIVPNTRFFEVHNISYKKFKDNIDEMKKYVENKKIKFIVYVVQGTYITPPEYINDNYELIYEDEYMFEHSPYTSYFYKLKEL